ncbi:MAG: hypothetical protein QM811_07995 [Pirellulales bacterium]
MVRSVFVDAGGFPILSEGSHRVDHSTPLADRWGGWYVTGKSGEQAHLGNMVIRGKSVARPFENLAGRNVENLRERLTIGNYLAAGSDIVALMVFEHQTLIHNLMTKASYAERQALLYESEFNRALGRPLEHRLESTTRRIQHAGDALLEGLLFVDETPLTDPIKGNTKYAENFTARGSKDERGRSLREFDLTKRMFRYPCSYLIETRTFDALPPLIKSHVATRLRAILRGDDQDKKYAHLSPADRKAIYEILTAVKPELWKALPVNVEKPK